MLPRAQSPHPPRPGRLPQATTLHAQVSKSVAPKCGRCPSKAAHPSLPTLHLRGLEEGRDPALSTSQSPPGMDGVARRPRPSPSHPASPPSLDSHPVAQGARGPWMRPLRCTVAEPRKCYISALTPTLRVHKTKPKQVPSGQNHVGEATPDAGWSPDQALPPPAVSFRSILHPPSSSEQQGRGDVRGHEHLGPNTLPGALVSGQNLRTLVCQLTVLRQTGGS